MLFCTSNNKKLCWKYGFLSFARNISNKFGKQLLDTATKHGINALKIASKKKNS